MKNSTSISIDFYRNLGKLFYAIAAADNKVRKEEFDALKQIIKSKWLTVDFIEVSFGTDNISQIEIVFDWLFKDGEYNAKTCFEDFIAFKNKNEALFTDNVKQLIMKTATAIASSFSGKNKSELIMLAKLNMSFQK
jgi:phosphomevalonate kinase